MKSKVQLVLQFTAACEIPGCRRTGICLAATKADPRRRLDRVDPYAYHDWGGWWNYTGHFRIHLPERHSLQASLRRHNAAGRRPWRAVCLRCIAESYVERGNIKIVGWVESDSTLFGTELTKRLRRIRSLRAPERALSRLKFDLERVVVQELAWLCLPRAERRRRNRGPDLSACGTMKARIARLWRTQGYGWRCTRPD